MHFRLLALLLTLCALLLVACGDDEGSSGGGSGDEADIEKVLQDGLTSKDPKVVCGGSLSTGFMDKVYGGEQKCVSVETENAKDGDQAESVDVSAIKINGEKADATVALKGGSNDGSKGPLVLIKQGGNWRVDDLSAELLRSQLETAATDDEELEKETLDCIKQKILDMPDAQLKEVAYGAIGEQEAAAQQFAQLVTTCDPGLVRREVEKSVRDSLEQQGVPSEKIDCVMDELKKAISDEELNKAASGDTSAVQQAGAKAAVECGVTGT